MNVIVDRAHRVCEVKYLYWMPINKSTFLRVNVFSSVAQWNQEPLGKSCS